MRKARIVLMVFFIFVVLDMGTIGIIAQTTGDSTSAGSNGVEDQFLPSKLTGADRELFQAVQSILSNDPEYNRLGYTDEQWRYLWTESTCLPRALAIKHPDEGYELQYLNRPLLQLVADINDLETTPKGTLLSELASSAGQNKKLKNIYDYTKTLLNLVSGGTPLGFALDLVKHAAEKTGELIKAKAAASSFDNVFANYRLEKEKAPNQDSKAITESMNLGTGAYRTDYSSIREFYLDLNKNANLGWDEKTTEDRILAELSFYLESRYRNDTGTLNSWDARITKPEDAIENQFRDVFHEMKIQLNKNMRDLTSDCVNEMNQSKSDDTKEKDSCGSVDYSKLRKIDLGSQVYYADSNALWQGTYTQYYLADKKELKATGCYLDNKKSGHWVFWDYRGNKSQEGDYKDGKREGHWIGWDNNIKVSEGDYKNGKEEGHWITYWPISGTKGSEVDYKNGMKEGHWVDWFDDGKKWHEGDYRDDKQIGTWTSWHEDGSIDHQRNEGS